MPDLRSRRRPFRRQNVQPLDEVTDRFFGVVVTVEDFDFHLETVEAVEGKRRSEEGIVRPVGAFEDLENKLKLKA